MNNNHTFSIINDLIKNDDSRFIKIIAAIANTALAILLIAASIQISFPNETVREITSTVMGIAGIIIMLAIVPLGLRFINRNQKIPVVSALAKVLLFMFVIPLIITGIIVTLGWIFHAPGINPK